MTHPAMPGYPTGYPQPGYPTGYPQQPGVPPLPPGYQFAANPGVSPAPVYPAQFQGPPQPAQPQPQPAGQPMPADPSARLWGPQYPQELQGRTVGEAMRYYGIMREDFVRRNQPQQPLVGQPQSGWPGQPSAQPQPQPQPQPQHSAQPRFPNQPVDPMRQTIVEALREVVPQFLEPVVAPLQQDALNRTYAGVAQRFSDWQNFQQDIVQSLAGAPNETLLNPAAWEAAYYHAKGRAMSQPRQLPAGPPVPQHNGPAGPPMPQPQFNPNFPPTAQPQQAFVEAPTPPAPPGMPGVADPRDEMFARKFGVPVEVYRSWKGGSIGMLRNPQLQPGAGPAAQGYPQPYAVPQAPMMSAPPMPGFQPAYPPQHFGTFATPPVPGYHYTAPPNGGGYGY